MVVEDLRVAVGLHADAATGCSGNVLLALLHEVADQPVVTEHDRLNLEERWSTKAQDSEVYQNRIQGTIRYLDVVGMGLNL